KAPKTYNTEDSSVVTDLSTNSAVSSLSRGERTGSRIFYYIWSYVIARVWTLAFIARWLRSSDPAARGGTSTPTQNRDYQGLARAYQQRR
ncbi:uncharacterized protein THITE_2058656, partial [Thermothielavioides terrestris NRRL 8126]